MNIFPKPRQTPSLGKSLPRMNVFSWLHKKNKKLYKKLVSVSLCAYSYTHVIEDPKNEFGDVWTFKSRHCSGCKELFPADTSKLPRSPCVLLEKRLLAISKTPLISGEKITL